MSGADSAVRKWPYRALLAGATLLVFSGLTFAVLSLPPDARGLTENVDTELAATGVGNAVTATLLYFRGYDTLLELTVLLLALVSIRAVRRGDPSRRQTGGEVLTVLAGLQAPTMILIAGYLLWSGAGAPGGAFQAAAVLAAAGVLLILAGIQIPRWPGALPIRAGLAAGVAVFVGLGAAGILAGRAFLDYPGVGGSAVTLLLEASAAASIALALLEMFHSVLRGKRPRGSESSALGEPR